MAARNRPPLSEVTLRHFVAMFLNVSTLEEFKSPIDLSVSEK